MSRVEASLAAHNDGFTTLDSKSDKGKSLENPRSYLADKVEPESRALRFYVTLPNRLVREDRQACGRRFVYWQFRPGQRTEIKVPVERWTDRIVLPVEAVAQDGAEAYVFEANGDHFDRRPVRVEYRDQRSVVIANDGSLKLGGLVAESAAHEMQLALKNKAGGGVDLTRPQPLMRDEDEGLGTDHVAYGLPMLSDWSWDWGPLAPRSGRVAWRCLYFAH